MRAALLRATPRLVAPRLPDLVFRYPDGRAFHLPADPGPYAQVFTRGEFEPGESAAVRQLLRPGDLAVDVGANLGWFSLVMAAAVAPGGEVWAIEPMPSILPALKRNLELNGALDVRLFEVALGESAGAVDINVFSGLPHGHASVSTFDRTDYTSHRVERRTLDDLLASRSTPAFVKLDVEGSATSCAGRGHARGRMPAYLDDRGELRDLSLVRISPGRPARVVLRSSRLPHRRARPRARSGAGIRPERLELDRRAALPRGSSELVSDVTAVITCFNYGRYLREAVDSAIGEGSERRRGRRRSTEPLPERLSRSTWPGTASSAQRRAGEHRLLIIVLDADDRLAPGALAALRAPLAADPALGFA